MADLPIDVVTLSGNGKLSGKKVVVTASCELMHNHLPASAIDPTKDLLIAEDSEGSPLVFSIGSDKRLRLLRHDSSVPGGWSSLELFAGVAAYTDAVTADISQDGSGNISVAAALMRADGSGTDVLFAPMLSNRTGQTDWNGFKTIAKAVGGIDHAFSASRLLLGSSDDGAPPSLTAVGKLGAQQHYYLLPDPASNATLLNFPEDLGSDPSALQDLAYGFALGQRAAWFLYTLGQSQSLICTAFATASDPAYTYDFSPGQKSIPASLRYTCIATPTSAGSNPLSISSDLYVGTADGISLFRGAKIDQFQTVATGINDVRQIVVRSKGDMVSVWAMSSPNELWYISGSVSKRTWNTPILFSNDCIHVAPIRSGQVGANEVFAVASDLSLTHSVQDPTSTLWHQSKIRVANSKFLLNVNTYTSTLHFEDETGTPYIGQQLDLTSSDWMYATVNGRLLSLDIDSPAAVTTDSTGNITVIVPASDISTPILHISSADLPGIVNVYPNGRVHQGLSSIRTGADLKGATANGKPVVDPSMDPNTADGTASNISQLADAGSQLASGTREAGAVYLSLSAARQNGALDIARIPHAMAVGATLTQGAWVPHTMAAVAPLSSIGDSIEMIAGDFLHWVENTFEDGLKAIMKGVTELKDGTTFLIQKLEDGLHFVMNLAGKVLSVALKTLGAVLKALNFVLKLIGIDLKAILAWLGHLLGWDVIWDTHKAMASLVRNGLDFAGQKIDGEIDFIKSQVMGALTSAKQTIDSLVVPPSVASQNLRSPGGTNAARNNSRNSAPANMVSYQMQHGGMLNGTSATVVAAGSLDNFSNDIIEPLIETVASDLVKIAEDLLALLKNPAGTVAEVKQLAADLLNLLLDPIIKLMEGLFKIVKELFDTVKSAVEGDIGIPFLGELYEFVTDLLGEEESFNVINATCFLLAIPIVEISRAAGMSTPADSCLGDSDLFQKLSTSHGAVRNSPMGNPAAPRFAAMSLMVTPAANASKPDAPAESPADNSLAHSYSVDGGFLGAGISLFEIVATLIGSISNNENSPFTFDAGTLGKVVLAMSLIRYAGTFPLRAGDYPYDAWATKVPAWVISAAGTILTLCLKMKGKISEEAEGYFGGVVNAITWVLLLVGDGIARDDALTWCVDIFSCGGGTALGVGQGSKNPYVIGGGLMSCAVGMSLGFALAASANLNDVVHLVNVGG